MQLEVFHYEAIAVDNLEHCQPTKDGTIQKHDKRNHDRRGHSFDASVYLLTNPGSTTTRNLLTQHSISWKMRVPRVARVPKDAHASDM